jgi:chromatin segregation and condensation protein Rec8/ScpA/Scc1 (kleisin family)
MQLAIIPPLYHDLGGGSPMNPMAEVLAHIQDENDRRTLAKLMKRHEVLRVRLQCQARPPRTESEKELIEHFLKQIDEWQLYGKRSRAQAQRLIDRNRELTTQVAALEEQLRQIVGKIEPHNRRLFQHSV